MTKVVVQLHVLCLNTCKSCHESNGEGKDFFHKYFKFALEFACKVTKKT